MKFHWSGQKSDSYRHREWTRTRNGNTGYCLREDRLARWGKYWQDQDGQSYQRSYDRSDDNSGGKRRMRQDAEKEREWYPWTVLSYILGWSTKGAYPAVIPINEMAAIRHLPPITEDDNATRSHITRNSVPSKGERALLDIDNANIVERCTNKG